jgi:glycosyltransferase involved in cell wall biosynthesis
MTTPVRQRPEPAGGPETLDITVAINTRNRADSLHHTLASLAGSSLPAQRSVELVVVDNGSTDRTREVVEAFRWPGVRVHYLRVDEPGVARAKNAAVRRSSGRALLFLDDDVRVPDQWMAGMSEQILAGEVDAVGGGIRIPDEPKPEGTTARHEEWLASTMHWEPTRQPVLVGANMAVARPVFDSVAMFNEELQHGEDTLISLQIIAAGGRLILRHDVIVDHILEPGRFSRHGMAEQARRRATWHAYEVHHWEHGTPSVPHLRALAAKLRLAWFRLRHRPHGDIPTPAELQLMQDAAFWPAYIRCRNMPRRYPPR